MADARIGVTRPFVREKDDGTASSWRDIYRTYRMILLRSYFRIRNSIQNGMWPTSSYYLLFTCVLCIYLMEFRPSKFVTVSSLLCNMSSVIPLPDSTPSWFRHILFSCVVSVTFFISLMKLRQYALRLLLSYKGWMYEMAKRHSYATVLWGLVVKFVSGYHPSLYSFQNSLPRMNVPPLNETLEKLLESLKPLCTDEEFQKYREGAKDLKNTIGNKLQRILYLKSWLSPNYVSDWWEKYAYLRSRISLASNSNYYIVDHYSWLPTTRQTSRAANMLHTMLYLKRLIDRERLRPLLIRNTIPVCMSQYERVFSTFRVPGSEIDDLVHYDSPKSRHIIVWCKGFYYYMPVYDEANQLLCPYSLETLFDDIKQDADAQQGENDYDLSGLPAVSALPRSEWANIYTKYFRTGIHGENMDIIKKAVCMVVLFDEVPKDISEKGKLLLHGNGSNIWFDKCLSLCVFPDGQSGLNCEHTMADGPVIAYIWEYALTTEVIEKRYLESGRVMLPPKSFKQKSFGRSYKLSWNFPQELRMEIARAVAYSTKNNNDLELILFDHNDFGKGAIKLAKLSPDAFIQIALQLTYYRDSGSFCQTYEASATRLFLQGRTETIRSCTQECCQFVRAMESGDFNKKDLIALLLKASSKHRELYLEAMSGQGVDRHLFALYVVSRGLGYSNEFLENVLSRPWTLSTSQQPQQQTSLDMPDINSDCFRKMVGPGGGFGPVSDDGYGVSYMIPTEYNIFFHVTSKKSSPKTSSERFIKLLRSSMRDMINLFDLLPKDLS